jgi:hypothetical protein
MDRKQQTRDAIPKGAGRHAQILPQKKRAGSLSASLT